MAKSGKRYRCGKNRNQPQDNSGKDLSATLADMNQTKANII